MTETPLFAGLKVIDCTNFIAGPAADEQALAIGALRPLGTDGMLTVDRPFTVEGSPKIPPRRAPDVGEHSSEILREVGYSDTEITAFKRSGVVAGV